MASSAYDDLKNPNENVLAYHMRLRDFAIVNNFKNPDNYMLAPKQIVEKNLVEKFKLFQHATKTGEERKKDEDE